MSYITYSKLLKQENNYNNIKPQITASESAYNRGRYTKTMFDLYNTKRNACYVTIVIYIMLYRTI